MHDMSPQARTFMQPMMRDPSGMPASTMTNEAALLTRWNGQLYAVLGQQNEDGRWQLRLWWKPVVTLIWFGGILIALGGGLALLGRLDLFHRMRRFLRRRADRKWETAT